MPKNIVVLSDGTGQEGGKEHKHDSNVHKLFRMLENRTSRQVVFYDRGLGTDWRRITGNAFGSGFSHNVLECYDFIFQHFLAKDRIYLFGFSRGAYTVRSLSGFVDLYGILPKSRPDLINVAWKKYRKRPRFSWQKDRRAEKADEFRSRHNAMGARVTFLGVWDTVGALGFPLKGVAKALDWVPWTSHKFHETTLSASVDYGCHALAIDDERKTFHPTLWVEPNPKVEQVWFAGMHSDVGGGYANSDLSDITLQWMVRHALQHGLHLYDEHEVEGDPKPEGTMNDSREGFGRLYRREQRKWELKPAPKVHRSVIERTKKREDYQPWILERKDCQIADDPSTAPVFWKGDALPANRPERGKEELAMK